MSELGGVDNGVATRIDPRALLAAWANEHEEWVRYVAGEVIATGRGLHDTALDRAYSLFRQEKGLDQRSFPTVEPLSTEAKQDEAAEPLSLVRLSDVRGVNALISGAVIEPHEGLTILFGENGTGKTGYSRIFKALADSRTADDILGNIEAADDASPSATIDYRVGHDQHTLHWKGERGVSPFTRMSIFDSPCVSYHVDDALDYVYVPAALALFRHVIGAIQAVGARIDNAISELVSPPSMLLSRFPRNSTVYAEIETLGASTDLEALRARRSIDPAVDEKVEALRQAIAALESNTIGPQIALRQREERVLQQGADMVATLRQFDVASYNQALQMRKDLVHDYEVFRSELFKAADLPAEPEARRSSEASYSKPQTSLPSPRQRGRPS